MGIIADHVTKVKASEVSVVTAKALELERAGRDIIRLSAGEPDFPTPDHIKLACIKALLDNKTKYPPVIGVPELREAICAKLKRDNALDYAPGQTIVCSGVKQGLSCSSGSTGSSISPPSGLLTSWTGLWVMSVARMLSASFLATL